MNTDSVQEAMRYNLVAMLSDKDGEVIACVERVSGRYDRLWQRGRYGSLIEEALTGEAYKDDEIRTHRVWSDFLGIVSQWMTRRGVTLEVYP